tara:strand:+ start:1043 stop:1534 length:492 start_codon:yes stop_codon:yes gene_type:complete
MNEKTHWLQSPNKNYLGHWDLPESNEMLVTIESAKWEEVKNPINNKSEVKRVVRFQDKGIKPLICNQTNAQSIVNSTGVRFMEDSKGAVICLFLSSIIDRRTKENVDCIRIKKEASITAEILETLYQLKKDKVNESQKVSIERIIIESEKPSYQKVYTYLNKL